MSKHTPGPWRYVGFESSMGAHVVVGHPTRDDLVCTVAGSPQNPVSPLNAALIAAAPDMLEALRAIAVELPDTTEVGEIARVAIAKAEGEAAHV